jgi:dihydrofolate reductase
MAAQVVLFHGVTLDGFIAEADGGIGYLSEFDGVDFGYEPFAAGVSVSLLGRTTFDQAASMSETLAFPGSRTIVVTSRPLTRTAAGIETYAGDVAALARRLRTETDGTIWAVGGAQIVRALLAAGEVDRIEHQVLPVLLGAGIPAYDRIEPRPRLRLTAAQTFERGIVNLSYGVERFR